MTKLKYNILEYEWRSLSGLPHSLSGTIHHRLQSELESWEGTPYMSGQQEKGKYVDCVRFITGVLDALFRIERTEPPRLHPDCCIHSPKDAWKALNLVLALYPDKFKEVTGNFLEPGDFIIVGPKNGGPGHGMIVGHEKNTLWHCVFPGVHYTGWALTTDIHKIFRIYRVEDRTQWA